MHAEKRRESVVHGSKHDNILLSEEKDHSRPTRKSATKDNSSTAVGGELDSQSIGAGDVNTSQCDLQVPLPDVKGSVDRRLVVKKPEWKFTPESKCNFKLWDLPATRECLRGSWVILSGGSQMQHWIVQLARSLAHGSLHAKYTVMSSLVDIIILDGKVVHKGIESYLQCKGYRRKHCFEKIHEAPAYSGRGETRITFFCTVNFGNMHPALHVLRNESSWSETPTMHITEVGIHYALHFAKYLHHGVILDKLLDKMHEKGRSALEDLHSFCASRPNLLGCYVMNIQHCHKFFGKVWTRTNQVITDLAKEHMSQSLRFFDLWTFTSQLRVPCADDHLSPASTLWAWQILLGGVCRNRPADGTSVEFEGSRCTALQIVRFCPASSYYLSRWSCALNTPCRLKVVGSPRLVA
jgi:hypothetical protein